MKAAAPGTAGETTAPPSRWQSTKSWLRRAAADEALRRAIFIVVAMRLVLGAIAVVIVHTVGETNRPPYLIGYEATHPLFTSLIEPWNHYDALIYEAIARHGYTPGSTDTAFFPLFPALMRGVAALLGGSTLAYPIGGLLISTVALVVALTALHHLVTRDVGSVVAKRAVLYTVLFPTAFFLLAPYTEALFLALSVSALLCARRRAWIGAAALASLAALCRPQGIVLVLPLAVEAVIEMRGRLRAGLPPLRRSHLMLAAPVAALGLFYLYAGTVVHVSELEAERRGWGVVLAAPWQSIYDSIRFTLGRPRASGWLNVICALGLVAGSVAAWRRIPWSYATYLAASAIALLSHEIKGFAAEGPLKSTDRFTVVLFPLFVLLALAGRRWRAVHVAVLIAFPLATLRIFWYSVQNVYVG